MTSIKNTLVSDPIHSSCGNILLHWDEGVSTFPKTTVIISTCALNLHFSSRILFVAFYCSLGGCAGFIYALHGSPKMAAPLGQLFDASGICSAICHCEISWSKRDCTYNWMTWHGILTRCYEQITLPGQNSIFLRAVMWIIVTSLSWCVFAWLSQYIYLLMVVNSISCLLSLSLVESRQK